MNNVQTGSLNAIETKTSNGWGRINLGYPTLSATFEASNGNQNGSMILVKVRRSNEPQFRTFDTTNNYQGNKYIFDLRDRNAVTNTNDHAQYNSEPTLGTKLDSYLPNFNDLTLVLQPNPTNGITKAVVLNKKQARIQWSVTNIFGQIVLEKYSDVAEIEFNTTNWSTGMYFVNCTSGRYTITEKLIVK